MGASYRAIAHVGPFNQGDVVEFDDTDPEHVGLIQSGWFELVYVSAPVAPIDLSGYTGSVREEYRALFAPGTATESWNPGSTGAQTPLTPEVFDGEDPGGAGPDARAQRRRESRRALRVRNGPADPEPSKGAGPEGHGEPGK